MRDIQPIPDRSAEQPAEQCKTSQIGFGIFIHAEGVPPGIESRHIREYIAAFIEDREPNLHEDILDRMPDIKAVVIGNRPMDLPAGRPCSVCGGFGYHLDQHKTPCGCKQGEGKEAA